MLLRECAMRRSRVWGLVWGVLLAWPAASAAQSSGNIVGRVVHDCTFSRPCNWGSHAVIAFSTAYVLRELHVPAPAAAGAAMLLYVGKEVRDHLKWRVLGSADSNGDLLSGCAGALLAYYLMKHGPPVTRVALMVGLDGRTIFAVNLRSP
jgi:hypothetical protein